jgi:hypothetical protein
MAEDAEWIHRMIQGTSRDQARWKPDPATWSVLEVINHLADEEVEDFRTMVDLILHAPTRPLPAIDPMGWVTSRHYNDRELLPSLERFLDERRRSLNGLANLDAPDWEASVQTPHGRLRAGDIAASWIIHDHWHMQQLIRIRRVYLVDRFKPYRTSYAGTL